MLSGLWHDSRRLSADVVETRVECKETHDGVCRVRCKLGETTQVEDVGRENIAQGWECLAVGGSVVGHCDSLGV